MKERVLVVHNSYQSRGGEDVVAESEADMLLSQGHEVCLYRRHNREIKKGKQLSTAARTFWSKRTVDDFRGLCKAFRPDVVHVHNTFPLISPSVFWAANEMAVPVVQTLHNFRLLCPQAMFFRDGQICELCVGRAGVPGVWFGCYRDSRAQTAVVAANSAVHKLIGTWDNKVTRYIALSDFCKRKFINGGFDESKIDVKPNFSRSNNVHVHSPRSGFLYVGRLTEEKGLRVLADSMHGVDIEMSVVGAGPCEPLVVNNQTIAFCGELDRDSVARKMSEVVALVVPSVWQEPFGLVVIEAFATGTPVIASRIGTLPELVAHGVTGLLVEPGNPESLRDALQWADRHRDEMSKMGQAAKQAFFEKFSVDVNYRMLINIYGRAIGEGAA